MPRLRAVAEVACPSGPPSWVALWRCVTLSGLVLALVGLLRLSALPRPRRSWGQGALWGSGTLWVLRTLWAVLKPL